MNNWFVVEEAETTHCLFAASPLKEIVFRMEEFGFPSLKYSGTEYIKDGGNYCFVEKEWKEAGKKYLELIKSNPELLDKVNREAIAWGEKLLVFGKELLNRKYDNLSNNELAELYNHFEFLREEAHIRRGVVWIVETGDEFFSSYLISYLKDEINKQHLDLNADSIFAILSTPLKTNNVFQEKTDFLRAAVELKKNKIQDNEKIKARLAWHIEKYCWLPYGVTGPAWDAGYFLKAMGEILTRGEDKIHEELEKEEKSLELTRKKQKDICEQLQIDELHRKLIQLARDSIYMKACTKEAMFFGYYAAEKLFKEIAGRLGIDTRLLRKVLPWEIKGLLEIGRADIGELEKRYEYSFHLTEKGESKILTGDEARKFVEAIKLKRGGTIDENVVEIRGNCAQAGSATGVVKIINAVADLSKMKKGDILVSKMTDPQIISALKMAAAIVTDMGGITCHAAIVSRELGIPCVIGTKIATKVLKDDDMVEVDANKGVVKKVIHPVKLPSLPVGQSGSAEGRFNRVNWRINFTVTNSNFNLVGYAAYEFLRNVPKKDSRQLFSEWYLEHERGTTTAFVKVPEIDIVTEWIKDKIVVEPDWADELHKETEKLNWEYFNYAKELLQISPTGLSNPELADKCCKLRRLQLESHVKAISTTWFLDSNNETYSNFLRNKLKQYLTKLGIDEPVKLAECFTLLTSPTRTNFAQEEQLDFLRLLKNPSEENIHQHYEKWRWTPYGYVGPVYDLQHYVDEVEKNLPLAPQVDGLIAEESVRYTKLARQQEDLVEKIKLPADLQHYFAIARDIIWLKDFRKYCIWHGHYVVDKFTKEIAKRLNISHRQANSFLIDEVASALVDGKLDVDLLNERDKYCMIWADENEQKIYYDKEAEKIRQSLDLEEVIIDVDSGLKGTCAFPGTAKGVIKIVNEVVQIDKINDGEIMLAHTTFPALLPAMKKAAAFVTEDGGITCHAAIVARELKKPCVVGVKSACSVLKDGDIVEVDATNGVISVIARSEGRATRQSINQQQ